MIDGLLQQLFQGPFPFSAMHADAPPSVCRLRTQHARRLSSDGFDEGEFFRDVTRVVRQHRRVASRVDERQRRSIFAEHALHPLGEQRFGVGQMTNDFQDAPTAGVRPRAKSRRIETGHRGSQRLDPGKVGVDYGCVIHDGEMRYFVKK